MSQSLHVSPRRSACMDCSTWTCRVEKQGLFKEVQAGGDSSVCGVGIGALSNLRELRVSGNKLSSLSAEVGSLRKLHRLIADGNLLTSIPGDRLLPASNPRNRQQHSSISA